MCDCEMLYIPQNRKTLFLRLIEKLLAKQSTSEFDIKQFRRTDAYEVLDLLDVYTSDFIESTNVLIKEIYLKKVDEK